MALPIFLLTANLNFSIPFLPPFPFSSPLPQFPFLSSPLLFLLDLALISCQDDAVETIKERHARFPLPEIYGLWEKVVHFVVCGHEQLAPPLSRPET